MAHTLGMSIQQHQQKSLLKFYVLPRARTSRFPEKSSEKRLKTPRVKVQVHRICLTRQLASFCHASKNGRKKARKSLKLLGFSQRHLFWCNLMAKNRNFDRNPSRGCNYGLEGVHFDFWGVQYILLAIKIYLPPTLQRWNVYNAFWGNLNAIFH